MLQSAVDVFHVALNLIVSDIDVFRRVNRRSHPQETGTVDDPNKAEKSAEKKERQAKRVEGNNEERKTTDQQQKTKKHI